MTRAALRIALLMLIALASAPSWMQAQRFLDSYRIPLSTEPAAITAGDLNGDGTADFVWIDSSTQPQTIRVLLSQAAGGWLPGISIPFTQATTRLTGCLLVDVNNDKLLDLVCADAEQFTIYIHVFLGNGDGTFQAPSATVVQSQSNGAWAIPAIYPVGDLNGDGIIDFYLQELQSQEAQILLSDGKGGFKTPMPAPAGPNYSQPVPADINGDGILDLLFPMGPEVALGKGDGSFGQAQNYANVSYYAATCVFHDMDGDGHLDAVCGYPETTTGDITGATDLIILHGNPDGSFNTMPIAQKRFGDYNNEFDGFGTFLTPLAVADINGDGIPDVLGASGDGLAVLLGGRGLTFSTPLHYARTSAAAGGGFAGYYLSAIYDVNGDGIPDAVDAGANGIYIAYGHRDGTYGSAFAPEVTEYIGYPTVADFNGDGIPDIAATGDTAIKLSLGKGDGTFAAPVALPNDNGAFNFSTPLSATNAHIVHGDFNGDGKTDLLAIGSSSIYQYDSYLYFGNGDGTFKGPVPVPNTSNIYPMYEPLVDSAVADINKDGKSDLLGYSAQSFGIAQGTIGFSLSNGDGTFNTVITTVPTDLWSGYSVMSLPALADFNGDGKLDAVYGGFTNVYLVKGNGDGSFNSTPTILAIPPFGNDPSAPVNAVATGDLDGDGNQDIVALMQYDVLNGPYLFPLKTVAWAYYGDGKGGFSAPVLVGVFDSIYNTVTIGDLNRDDRADIVVKTSGSLAGGFALGVIGSLPGRTFGPEVNYAAGTGESSLAIADLNGDGWPDLVIGNGDYNVRASSVTLLMNLGNTDVVNGNLFATPEPSVVTQAFTLKATLTPPTPGILNGSIGFLIDGNAVGTATLTSNVATLPVAGTYAVGQHSLEATWAGDKTYPSLTLFGTHLVVVAPTTTTITSSLNPAPAGTSITFTATVGSTYGKPSGTVTFTDGTTALGTITLIGGVARYMTSSLTVGTHTITASYAGNANFAASSASLNEAINGLMSGTSLSAIPNPAYVGQAVTLNATVSGNPTTPTGRVSFVDGTAAIGSSALNASGISTLSATFATAGIHNLTAAYSGDSVFDASTSGVYAENVLLNPTGITVSGTPNPALAFQTISFSAPVTSATGYVATGTVTFLANGTAMGTGTLQTGKALFSTSSLPAGTYAITASYGGSTGASASTSAPFTLVVGQESSQTALTSSVNPALLGTGVTFTATVTTTAGAPTGAVQFYDAGNLLATTALNGQTATYSTSTLALGTHPITAVYSGNSNIVGSTSPLLDESIVAYVGDFSIGANPASMSIYTGQAARFQMTVKSVGGFNEPVSLACSGLSAETTCSFSPVTIANGQGTSTLTLRTSAPQRVSANDKPGLFGKSRPAAIALAALMFVFAGRRRRWPGWVALLILGIGMGMSACGRPAAIGGGTTPGKYTVIVTGSYAAPGAPSLTHATTVKLDVKSLF